MFGNYSPWKVALGLIAAFVPAYPVVGQPVTRSRSSVRVGPTAPMVVCFADGTNAAYVAGASGRVDLWNRALFGADYFTANRWPGGQGTPTTLTWSFVPDGLNIPGSALGDPDGPSNLFERMDEAFASQGGREGWVQRFQQAFDRWSELTGLTFVRTHFSGNDWDDGATWGSGAAAGLRGDIRISMHPIDGVSQILAYNFFPSNGDMVLDSADMLFFSSATDQNRSLRNLLAHEVGHGIGLRHVCPADGTKLMEPFINTSYDGPRQDDIRGSQFHYGDPFENNDTPATAYALGSFSAGTPLTAGSLPSPPTGTNDPNVGLLSIDATAKTDFFRFAVSTATTVTVTATPMGSTYDNSTQNANGSCNSGNLINTLAFGDLAVAVYAANGTTLLGQANLVGAGDPEVLGNMALPAAGNYYVRITSATVMESLQSYRLSIADACSPEWAQLVVSGPQPGRMYHAVAYDSQRSEMLVFGGTTGAQRLGETWAWDGVAWTLRATTGPTPRDSPAMAYDSARDRVVLFGGYPGQESGETWEWSGSAWELRSTTGPSPRHNHGMAYSVVRQRIVLFGGSRFGGWLDDTWEWDGTQWTAVPGPGPSPRDAMGMAYDAARGKVVMHGGGANAVNSGETWEYDGTWSLRTTNGPAGRTNHDLAYDSNTGRTVLFGGAGPTGLLSDTWQWDGSSWNQINVNGPSARYGYAMAYHGATDRTVLTGGTASGTSALATDTWEWLPCGETCYPDCNGDGQLTVADFGCFQGKYVLADPYADCNSDSAFSVADFGCFQTKYVLGCP